MNTVREMIGDAFIGANAENSIVKPYVLGHGTLECFSLKASRKFYTEFLGLECVQHAPRAMAVRCGMKFHIICVQALTEPRPQSFLTHWGLDVQTREKVDAAYANAVAMRERYGIRQVTDIVDQHGVYSFYMEDLDQNWWEIQHYAGGYQHDDIFDFGDTFDSSTA